MTEHRPRHRFPALACLLLTVVVPAHARAQAGISLLDDVSVTPPGVFRLRTAGVWTRYEERFTSSGTTPLGAPFITGALGSAALPRLATTEALVQDASAAPFTISLGASRLDVVAREEHVPLTIEYGLRKRLSLTFMMPVVRKRASGLLTLDSLGSNVGPNPVRLSSAIRSANQVVQAQFGAAAGQLQNALATCTASPSSPGCPALLARQAEAQALITNSQSFAATVEDLYGSASSDGEAFVPRSSSPAQSAIASRVSAFNDQYKDLLATSTDLITAVPGAAAGPAGSANIITYLYDLSRDSLTNAVLLGVGDVEAGFRWLALDRAGPNGDRGVRAVIASSWRFPSGSRQAPPGVADLRIGDGLGALTARGLLDVAYGRLGLLAAASAEVVLGASPDTAGVPLVVGYTRAPDRWRRSLAAEPRWQLTSALAVHGSYAVHGSERSAAHQLAGGGVSFTTVSRYRSGMRPLPMEMRFSHLQAVQGDAGAPRITRDQLEVRIYYQRAR